MLTKYTASISDIAKTTNRSKVYVWKCRRRLGVGTRTARGWRLTWCEAEMLIDDISTRAGIKHERRAEQLYREKRRLDLQDHPHIAGKGE